MRSLTFGSNANVTYEWEAGASTQDSIMVTGGPLNLTGIKTTLKLFDRGLGLNVTPDQKFALITVAGTNSITGFDPANFTVNFTDTPYWSTSQYTLSLDTVGGNSVIYLSNISPVPEPAGVLAVAAAGLMGVALRRRVRRSRGVTATAESD